MKSFKKLSIIILAVITILIFSYFFSDIWFVFLAQILLYVTSIAAKIVALSWIVRIGKSIARLTLKTHFVSLEPA